MRQRGLDPAAPPAVDPPLNPEDTLAADLRHLAWCSVDNGEGEEVSSKDLDQITAGESLPDGRFRVWVAVADVDWAVEPGSPADDYASENTVTVYTAEKIFPMLDPKLSEDLTSLNPGEDRLALVTEMIVGPSGDVDQFTVSHARVRSRVKLNYEGVGRWLEGKAWPPRALQGHPDVITGLRAQDKAARKLQERRRQLGSLDLESREAHLRLVHGRVNELTQLPSNRANELIENLMVACNGCASRFLRERGFPTFQRVVRAPKYWDQLVKLAEGRGGHLPPEPDPAPLQQFLEEQREQDPDGFPDLSLAVLKLLGRGEYVVELPGEPHIGHFGLAVREYSHSTAPNRRYPDLLTQRMIKAALAGRPCPFSEGALRDMADHCSQQESNADKVQRQVQKSATAALLSERIGEVFRAQISGVNQVGTWVRLLDLPVEGKYHGTASIGDKLDVRLSAVHLEKGFLDFDPV